MLISKPSGNALPEGSLMANSRCCLRFAQGINFG
jgi:hypothetical protein